MMEYTLGGNVGVRLFNHPVDDSLVVKGHSFQYVSLPIP